MALGAIQLEIVINNQSFTIKKDHAVSLKLDRVIGDAANKFVLEAFDETAWQLENAMMHGQLAPITVRYSAAEDTSKSYMFSGMCTKYNLTFVGRATMLSIEGVMTSHEGAISGFWFGSQAIEWCGSDYDEIDGKYYIDGKSEDEFNNYKDNKDVCAIVKKDYKGNPTAFFNPSRIFERIIHVYNGDKLGTYKTTAETSGGSGDGDNTKATTMSKSRVKNVCWLFLKNKGFSDEAAAAVMGNIQQESSFMTKDTKGGLGIFQSVGERRTALINWAKRNNKNYLDASTQIEYAYKEMPGMFRTYTGWTKRYSSKISAERAYYGWPTSMTLDDFKDYTKIAEATEIFSRVFERPGKPLMDKRKSYAKGFYKAYTGKNADAKTKNLARGSVGASISDASNKAQKETSEYQEVKGWGTGGKNGFKLGDVDPSRWISGLDTKQQAGETTAEYITRVLCKNAVTQKYKNYDDETAGFTYYMKNGKHCFKALEYNNAKAAANAIKISYGQQNSNVISFSVADIGAIAMAGVTTDSANKYLAGASSMDYITGDLITAAGENVLGVDAISRNTADTSTYLNWYLNSKSIKPVKVVSSTTHNALETSVNKTFNDLRTFTISAELTLWAEYSKTYYPGSYINISVVGAGNILHYASGTYYITKVTDTISSSGYTQTLKLLRISPKDVTNAEPWDGDEIDTDLIEDTGTTSYTDPYWEDDDYKKKEEETKKKIEDSGRNIIQPNQALEDAEKARQDNIKNLKRG